MEGWKEDFEMNNNLAPSESSPLQASRRVFPLAGTPLAAVIGEPSNREAFHKKLQSLNKFVVAFYRIGLLSLFGAGKTTMLLITMGRKSRRLRSFPVGYFRIAGEIHLLSGWGKSTNWYKNIVANPEDVWLQIGFRRFAVLADFIENPEEIRRTIEAFLSESPSDAQRLFGWDPQRDRIEAADFTPIIEKVLFVKFAERQENDKGTEVVN
jgi:deazaflavin-dependent oxidoreductase (nitroreductase family)